MTYYKSVRLDRTSHYDRKTKWRKGSIIKPDCVDPDNNKGCGNGIHCSTNLLDTVKYQQGSSRYCEVEPVSIDGHPAIICDSGDKVRCPAVKVVRWLNDRNELDEIAGFKLWEANHPVNPLLIRKPGIVDFEQLLREWSSVRSSVRSSVESSVRSSIESSVESSVWSSVRSSVWSSVGSSVWSSVGSSVRSSVESSVWPSVWLSVGSSVESSVWSSVRAYIGGLFPSITTWQYAEKLGAMPWQPLLDLWYAGYIPSFDGTTWRLHAGKDAKVVFEITQEKLHATE